MAKKKSGSVPNRKAKQSEPRKLKTFYRARYLIDVELTTRTLDNPDGAVFRVTLENSERPDPEDFEPDFRFDYIEKNFPEAVELLFFRMLWLEADLMRMAKFKPDQDKAKIREIMIKFSGKVEQQRVRSQNPRPKGRIADSGRRDFDAERQKFIDDCLKILSDLESQGRPMTRTNVAKEKYDAYSNELRELRDRLKRYGLSFNDDLVKRVTEK